VKFMPTNFCSFLFFFNTFKANSKFFFFGVGFFLLFLPYYMIHIPPDNLVEVRIEGGGIKNKTRACPIMKSRFFRWITVQHKDKAIFIYVERNSTGSLYV